MAEIFLKILNMSINACWIILAVLILRLLLRSAPKFIRCILWSLAAVRLICPLSFESIISLIPSKEPIPEDIIYSDAPAIQSGIPAVNEVINPVISENFTPAPQADVSPLEMITDICAAVWIIGTVLMLLYIAVSWIRIYKEVRVSVRTEKNIYICDGISSPFILGVFSPRIYLPSDLSPEAVDYVIAHERAHLKRLDHLWKPLGYLILSVYWFNPLVWLAYILLCRDIELACDEKVIKGMEAEDVKDYSRALLSCSVPRRMIIACPVAFGEVGVKARIRYVLNYKRPAFWIIIAAVIACVAVSVFFLTSSPADEKREQPKLDSIKVTDGGSVGEDISVFIEKATLCGEKPSMTVRWYNDSEKEYTVTDEFYILREKDGELKDCRIGGKYTPGDENHIIPPEDSVARTYYLHSIELSEKGKYCFKSSCMSEGEKYEVSIYFEIDEPQELTLKGRIIKKTADSILIEPYDKEFCEKHGEKVYVSTVLPEGRELPALDFVSDVLVRYNGYVLNTSPAQITNVYDICGIDEWSVEKSGDELYLFNGFSKGDDPSDGYRITESIKYDADGDGADETFYITDKSGMDDVHYAYIVMEKGGGVVLFKGDVQYSDYTFCIADGSLYIVGNDKSVLDSPRCYVVEYKDGAIGLSDAWEFYNSVIYPAVLEAQFGEEPKDFPSGTHDYETLKRIILEETSKVKDFSYSYRRDQYLGVLSFLCGKRSEYFNVSDDDETWEFYKALDEIKISSFSLEEYIAEGYSAGYLVFGFTVSESDVPEFPEGNYVYVITNTWEKVTDATRYALEYPLLYQMVSDISSCGFITWENGKITFGNEREAIEMMAYISSCMPYEYGGWNASDGLSDARFEEGVRELFGFDASKLDLNKTMYYQESDTGLWYAGISPTHNSYSQITEIRDMGKGRFEIDVLFYGDHNYICPSHTVTYYASVTDDETYRYCIDKAQVTDESRYEPA